MHSLRLGDDTQIRTCDATRFDFPIPRTLNRDTCEQDEQEGGGGNDGKKCNEKVCVLIDFTVCGRYDT